MRKPAAHDDDEAELFDQRSDEKKDDDDAAEAKGRRIGLTAADRGHANEERSTRPDCRCCARAATPPGTTKALACGKAAAAAAGWPMPREADNTAGRRLQAVAMFWLCAVQGNCWL